MTCTLERFVSRTKARREARRLTGGTSTPNPVWCAVCHAWHLPRHA